MNALVSRLTPREQMAVSLAAAALLAAALYGLVWSPLLAARDTLRSQLASDQAALAWMRTAAPELRRLQATGAQDPSGKSADGRSLLTRVDQTGRAAGLASGLKRVEPQGGDRVRVSLEQVRFDALLGWIAALDAEHGIGVDVLNIERTERSGWVDARVVFQEPSR